MNRIKNRAAGSAPWQWMGLVVVLVGAGMLLLTRLSGATTVLAKSFAALVQDAEVIVVGTVTAIEAEWDAQQEAPFTLVTFTDLEVVKGDASQTELTLRILGGPTPDGLILQVAGVPQFRLGERSVVFSVGNQRHAVPLVGLWQGVYRVGFDAERGLETVHTHAGHPLTRLPTGEGGILHDRDEGAGGTEGAGAAMPLATFLERIDQEVSRGQ